MNRLFLVLAIALMCLAGWTVQAKLQKEIPTKQNWEFLEVELDTRFQSAPKLNQYGNEG